MWWHDKESDWWPRGTSLLHGLEFLTAREIQGTLTKNSPCNSTRFFYYCPVWLKLLPLIPLGFFCSFFGICIYGLVLVFCAYKFLTKDIKVLSVKIAENVALWTLRKKKKEENMIAILCLVNMFSICTLLEKTFWGEIYRIKD